MPKYQAVTASEANGVHGPRPGAVALQDVILMHYAGRLGTDGIYNHRKVRGSLTSWSLHAAGRAIDIHVPPTQAALGGELMVRLVKSADALGVCEVIWNRTRWDGTSGQTKPYGGSDPHTTHVHIGMTVDIASRPNTPDLHKWFDFFLFGV